MHKKKRFNLIVDGNELTRNVSGDQLAAMVLGAEIDTQSFFVLEDNDDRNSLIVGEWAHPLLTLKWQESFSGRQCVAKFPLSKVAAVEILQKYIKLDPNWDRGITWIEVSVDKNVEEVPSQQGFRDRFRTISSMVGNIVAVLFLIGFATLVIGSRFDWKIGTSVDTGEPILPIQTAGLNGKSPLKLWFEDRYWSRQAVKGVWEAGQGYKRVLILQSIVDQIIIKGVTVNRGACQGYQIITPLAFGEKLEVPLGEASYCAILEAAVDTSQGAMTYNW